MNSKIISIQQLNGWLVGQFSPSLVHSKEIEVGFKCIKKGTLADSHYHKLKTEYTILLSGKLRVGDTILTPPSCVVLEPHFENDHDFLEDSIILIINTPSVQGDKYYD